MRQDLCWVVEIRGSIEMVPTSQSTRTEPKTINHRRIHKMSHSKGVCKASPEKEVPKAWMSERRCFLRVGRRNSVVQGCSWNQQGTFSELFTMTSPAVRKPDWGAWRSGDHPCHSGCCQDGKDTALPLVALDRSLPSSESLVSSSVQG